LFPLPVPPPPLFNVRYDGKTYDPIKNPHHGNSCDDDGDSYDDSYDDVDSYDDSYDDGDSNDDDNDDDDNDEGDGNNNHEH
jgi:hypothetical protein